MSDRPTFEERLADPLSHFPYKHDDAREGAAREEMRRGLEAGHTDEMIEDSINLAHDEVDATAAYVEAQEAYFRDPTPERRQAEREAAAELQEARRKRREVREDEALAEQDEEA